MRIVRTFSVEFSVLGLLAGSRGRGLCESAHTGVAAQAWKWSFHIGVDRRAGCARGTAVLATCDGLDCELQDSWAAAAGSAREE